MVIGEYALLLLRELHDTCIVMLAMSQVTSYRSTVICMLRSNYDNVLCNDFVTVLYCNIL